MLQYLCLLGGTQFGIGIGGPWIQRQESRIYGQFVQQQLVQLDERSVGRGVMIECVGASL